MEHIRYSVAACQTDLPNPVDRRAMRANTDRMLSMIDSAVAGSAPFLPVRLVVFPEFAHAAPVFPSAAELIEKLAVEIPNEHTERLWQKGREYEIYIQSGSMLEVDTRWPGVVFNTTFTRVLMIWTAMTILCFPSLIRQLAALVAPSVTTGYSLKQSVN